MTSTYVVSTALLLGIAGSLFNSRGCEWNEDTEKRWKEAKKTYCEVLEDMKKDRDSQCSKANVFERRFERKLLTTITAPF